MSRARTLEGALSASRTPDTPPAQSRLVPLEAALEPWPWPCHRNGHVFTDSERCVHCSARNRWDDVPDIVATGRRKFAAKRAEELPSYNTLPSGLLLDLG